MQRPLRATREIGFAFQKKSAPNFAKTLRKYAGKEFKLGPHRISGLNICFSSGGGGESVVRGPEGINGGSKPFPSFRGLNFSVFQGISLRFKKLNCHLRIGLMLYLSFVLSLDKAKREKKETRD